MFSGHHNIKGASSQALKPGVSAIVSAFACVLMASLAAGCSGAFFKVSPEETAASKRAGTPVSHATDSAAVATPAARLPELPEPDAVASDSAGVQRLIRLAMLWQTVRQHHPYADEGTLWDDAVAQMIPAVRAARDTDALAAALTTLLGVLQDPMTRVERNTPRSASSSAAAPVRIALLPGTDSVVLLRIPPAAGYTRDDSATLAGVVARTPSRVVIDLRGETGNADLHNGDAVNALLLRTQFVSALLSTPLHLGERRERVYVPPTLASADFLSGAMRVADGATSLLLRDHGLLAPTARRAVRTAVLVNSGSAMPQQIAAMVASGRAWLVREERAAQDLVAPSVLMSMGDGVAVRVRTSEEILASGAHTLHTDSVVRAATSGGTPDESVQAAMALLRSTRTPPSAAVVASSLAGRTHALRGYQGASSIESTPYPEMGARLLAAFTVWSTMRTRHAHRDAYDDDIDAVFERTIPRVEAAQNREQYTRALGDLVASFDDSQVRLQRRLADSRADDASAPFRVRMIEGRMIVTSLTGASTTSGIAVGSEITAADGYPMAAWLQEHRRDVSASNEWTRQRDLADLLPRGTQGNATFKVRDATGPERTVTVMRTPASATSLADARARLAERTAPPFRTTGDIVYFDLARLDNAAAAPDFAALGNARAVILDLRGALALSPELVIQRFATRPDFTPARAVSRPVTAPCIAPTLREAARECPDERVTAAIVLHGDSSATYRGRVVVLIDERTQDAAERLALALEAGAGATLVGSPSAGAAAPTVSTRLPGNLTLHFPPVELRRADGGQLHRVGLTPSVDARPTVRGVRAGTDETFDRAIAWITGQLDGPRRRR